MNIFRMIWSPGIWWPSLLGTGTALFAVREIWALASGHPEGTLSDWLWRLLGITRGESPAQWSAAAFLTFGIYVVVAVWLAFHFWLRRFT